MIVYTTAIEVIQNDAIVKVGVSSSSSLSISVFETGPEIERACSVCGGYYYKFSRVGITTYVENYLYTSRVHDNSFFREYKYTSRVLDYKNYQLETIDTPNESPNNGKSNYKRVSVTSYDKGPGRTDEKITPEYTGRTTFRSFPKNTVYIPGKTVRDEYTFNSRYLTTVTARSPSFTTIQTGKESSEISLKMGTVEGTISQTSFKIGITTARKVVPQGEEVVATYGQTIKQNIKYEPRNSRNFLYKYKLPELGIFTKIAESKKAKFFNVKGEDPNKKFLFFDVTTVNYTAVHTIEDIFKEIKREEVTVKQSEYEWILFEGQVNTVNRNNSTFETFEVSTPSSEPDVQVFKKEVTVTLVNPFTDKILIQRAGIDIPHQEYKKINIFQYQSTSTFQLQPKTSYTITYNTFSKVIHQDYITIGSEVVKYIEVNKDSETNYVDFLGNITFDERTEHGDPFYQAILAYSTSKEQKYNNIAFGRGELLTMLGAKYRQVARWGKRNVVLNKQPFGYIEPIKNFPKLEIPFNIPLAYLAPNVSTVTPVSERQVTLYTNNKTALGTLNIKNNTIDVKWITESLANKIKIKTTTSTFTVLRGAGESFYTRGDFRPAIIDEHNISVAHPKRVLDDNITEYLVLAGGAYSDLIEQGSFEVKGFKNYSFTNNGDENVAGFFIHDLRFVSPERPTTQSFVIQEENRIDLSPLDITNNGPFLPR